MKITADTTEYASIVRLETEQESPRGRREGPGRRAAHNEAGNDERSGVAEDHCHNLPFRRAECHARLDSSRVQLCDDARHDAEDTDRGR